MIQMTCNDETGSVPRVVHVYTANMARLTQNMGSININSEWFGFPKGPAFDVLAVHSTTSHHTASQLPEQPGHNDHRSSDAASSNCHTSH